jgi:hypothetical protein
VIVVSEETSSISLVMGGEMAMRLDAPRLRIILRDILSGERRDLSDAGDVARRLELAVGADATRSVS